MTYWGVREELSQAGRLRRSYYELLRDELDQFMLQYAIVDSYKNFRRSRIKYPFVEKRELKPRARIPDLEYENQNAFLVIFVEDSIPSDKKKYIKFFDVNKTTKKNLLQCKALELSGPFDRHQKYLDSAHFYNFIKALLPVDYALLIQRDAASKTKDRYILSNFHVRVDWPTTDAAEDLAQNLRYISQDLYEQGDRYAEDIQKKFFENYGLPVMVGGRRTAAIVVTQFLKQVDCISTVYVASSESRALIRVSERGVSKAILMRLTEKEINSFAEANQIQPLTLKKNYAVAHEKNASIFIFQATYGYTSHSLPPEDGKLRELKPDLNWLTVSGQHILPKPGVWKAPPISSNMIYS